MSGDRVLGSSSAPHEDDGIQATSSSAAKAASGARCGSHCLKESSSLDVLSRCVSDRIPIRHRNPGAGEDSLLPA